MDTIPSQVETAEPGQFRLKTPEPSPSVTGSARHPTSDSPGETSGSSANARVSTRHGAAAKSILKWLATLAIAAIAVVVSLVTWDYYVTDPWTRDGRIRVQVANVAPQVSGQITELKVADNQYVNKGDLLYVIDPFDFEVALRENQALVEQRTADLDVKQLQSKRRQQLPLEAASLEEKQMYSGDVIQAKAALEAAKQQVAQSEVDLRRTQVLSPVNGYITNLLLRAGDYARTGETNVSVIDTDSYWIDGYFEETKMAQVCLGDRVAAKLMGYSEPIIGHVTSVTRGIDVSNATAGVQGLPSVDPVYTWVRLAERVPVRIAIDKVPQGVPLIAGMTATISVHQGAQADQGSWLARTVRTIANRLSAVFNGRSVSPGCILPVSAARRTTELPAGAEAR